MFYTRPRHHVTRLLKPCLVYASKYWVLFVFTVASLEIKPGETRWKRFWTEKVVLFGVPVVGVIVLLSCFVGCAVWRHKRRRGKKLNSEVHSTMAEKKAKNRKAVVTRGENSVL